MCCLFLTLFFLSAITDDKLTLIPRDGVTQVGKVIVLAAIAKQVFLRSRLHTHPVKLGRVIVCDHIHQNLFSS